MAKQKGIPKRSPEQKAEVGAFIDRLYELSGSETIVDFASRAGLYGSNVGEYRSGTAMPDAYTLIRLMASVDVQLTARDEAVDLPAVPGLRVRPQGLEEEVDELLQWQPSVIADLDEIRTRLVRLESERGSLPGTQESQA